MLTKVPVLLPAASGGTPSVTAVDTGQVELPITVSGLPLNVSRRDPYLKGGRIFVDFINSGPSTVSLDMLFCKRWKHLL